MFGRLDWLAYQAPKRRVMRGVPPGTTFLTPRTPAPAPARTEVSSLLSKGPANLPGQLPPSAPAVARFLPASIGPFGLRSVVHSLLQDWRSRGQNGRRCRGPVRQAL